MKIKNLNFKYRFINLILKNKSPVRSIKAAKNNVEIENTRKCQVLQI